jgi:hypothetical protein
MEMCKRMTAQLSAGVQLIQACSSK